MNISNYINYDNNIVLNQLSDLSSASILSSFTHIQVVLFVLHNSM